jgi:hypothetical protein
MPRPSRDERRAQAAHTARNWGQWLGPAVAESGLDVKTIVELAGRIGGTFDKSNMSKWLAGDSSADSTNVVVIARVLGRDPLDALRVAGYGILANQLAAEPTADDVLRATHEQDTSATVLLRETGHAELADYIESITGPGGPRPVDLDAAIARTREIIGDMTPEELDAYEKSLLRQIRESRKRAEKTTPEQHVHTANGNGTQGVS